MSVVTSLILVTGLGEDVNYLRKKFEQFKSNASPFYLGWIDDESLPEGWYGGSKFMSANLFLGAYNHLNLADLVSFMQNEIEWDTPYFVQLIVKEHGDDRFRIINVFSNE